MDHHTRETLDIRGLGGRVVPNALWRPAERSRHLVILYPGWAYPGSAPLLYYCRLLALELGADALVVDYGYDRFDAFRELADDDQDVAFGLEITAALIAGCGAGDYARTTLLGKSLGTQAVAQLLASEPRAANADAVLLTPTLDDVKLRDQLRALRQRCLFVVGSRDPHASEDNLALARSAGEVLVIAGADHSLDVGGSVESSIHAITTTIDRVRRFLQPSERS